MGSTVERSGLDDLADTAVEALDHAVGLRVAGLDEAVLNPVLVTGLIEGVIARWLSLTSGDKAIGKLLAVVG